MTITMNCPHCCSKLRVEERLAGSTRPCPKCHQPVAIRPTESAGLDIDAVRPRVSVTPQHEPKPNLVTTVFGRFQRLPPILRWSALAGGVVIAMLVFLALMPRTNPAEDLARRAKDGAASATPEELADANGEEPNPALEKVPVKKQLHGRRGNRDREVEIAEAAIAEKPKEEIAEKAKVQPDVPPWETKLKEPKLVAEELEQLLAKFQEDEFFAHDLNKKSIRCRFARTKANLSRDNKDPSIELGHMFINKMEYDFKNGVFSVVATVELAGTNLSAEEYVNLLGNRYLTFSIPVGEEEARQFNLWYKAAHLGLDVQFEIVGFRNQSEYSTFWEQNLKHTYFSTKIRSAKFIFVP